MAETNPASFTAAVKKLWANKVRQQAMDDVFFARGGMIGEGAEGSNSFVEKVTELTETERGTSCVMHLVKALQNDGTVGDEELVGNEEALELDTCEIRIDMLRHGTGLKGRLSEQATVFRFRTSAKNELARWMADKMDELAFLTLSGIAYSLKLDGSSRTDTTWTRLAFAADVTAPSAGRKFFAGSATSTATLTSSDTLAWDRILELRAQMVRSNLRGVRDGNQFFTMITSPEGMRDLKKDSRYNDNVSRAETRGSSNPLFKGAVAVVDGIIVREANKVATTLGLSSGSRWGASGTVHGAQTLLLGAQALGLAQIHGVEWKEDERDYGNKTFFSAGQMLGLKKPVYEARDVANADADFAVISFYHAAAPID